MTVVADRPGAASARKLLRSIFTKSMGAAAIEAMETARAMGCEDWLYQELAAELATQDAAHLDRLLEGNRIHARRRIHEMTAAASWLGPRASSSSSPSRRCERSHDRHVRRAAAASRPGKLRPAVVC